MRMTRLKLQNFRCFDSIDLEFDERLTVLVAPNGHGKTAVLDAIRIALWPYISAFDVVSGTLAGSGIGIDDVMIRPIARGGSLNMEPQLPCEISAGAIIENNPIWWSRSRAKVSAGSRTSVKDAAPLVAIGTAHQSHIRDIFADEDRLPMLGYYGTGRIWKKRKLKLQRKGKHDSFSRSYAYVGCMDPAADYRFFMDWFFFNFAADFEQKSQLAKGTDWREAAVATTPYGEILSAVANAVERVMVGSGWAGLRYSPSNFTLVMTHPEFGVLKVDQLSDGQRNLIAMAGDIAYRCARLNPHLGIRAPLETEGIVLIDEIDLHLHPQWQQLVLAGFREAFPQIQFIVTTHSPQVLTSIHKEHIRTLGRNATGANVASIPLASSYGEISSDVLESIMLVDPHPPIKEKPDLQRLVELVDQGQYVTAEAQTLLRKLENGLRPDHPQLQRIKRSITRQEAFKR